MSDFPVDATTPDGALLAKSRIREAALSARDALDESERRAASSAIAHTVLGMWDLDLAGTVLAYVATRQEVDPHPIVEALRVRGVRVALPRVEGPARLSLHAAEDSQLVVGSFGILEPDPSAPRVLPEQVDAAIVPGVAFDPECNRVGYGGGYYDRLLPSLRDDCPLIGLAFDEQMVPEIPSQPHDSPLDVVVTQTTVHRRAIPAQPVDALVDEYAGEGEA